MTTLRPRLLCIFLSLLLAWETNSLSITTSVIRTSSGPVKGVRVNLNDTEVHQFLGIPFAQPPIGPLRFRKPQPVKPWSEVWMADRTGPACLQYEEYDYPWYDAKGGKSENCLYLNIWVPHSGRNNMENNTKPVMFWVYGGGFSDGSNRLPVYNGLVLAAKGDVIVVTTNYRVSTLGFFTSGTETAPGNVGLHDVLESLKWVNQNIDAFGGDPNQVTLSGESAGAVIVGLLCVSPLTKGLFKRAILESGSPAYLGAENNTANINKSQRIAEVLGCADDLMNIYDEPDEVVDCLRKKNGNALIVAVKNFSSAISQSFAPNYGDDILPVNARMALISGQFHQNVDLLIGNNHDEGSFKLVSYFTDIFGAFGEKNPKINKTLGTTLLEKYFKDFPATDELIKHYLGNLAEDDYEEIREQVYIAMGDSRILCPTKYFAEVYSKYQNKVYYYFYVHRPRNSPWAKWMKVAHFEEVQFVFGIPLLKPRSYTDREVHLSSRMVKIWTNFIKYGSPERPEENEYPESSWPFYSREDPTYVILGATIKKSTNVRPGATTQKSRKGYGSGPHKKNCDFFRPYFGFA